MNGGGSGGKLRRGLRRERREKRKEEEGIWGLGSGVISEEEEVMRMLGLSVRSWKLKVSLCRKSCCWQSWCHGACGVSPSVPVAPAAPALSPIVFCNVSSLKNSLKNLSLLSLSSKKIYLRSTKP